MSCRLLIKNTLLNTAIYTGLQYWYVAQSRRVGGGYGELLKIYGVKTLSLFTDSPLRAKESWSLILVTSI